MNLKKSLIALSLFAGSMAANAAGSPMNEDFSNLIQLSNKVIESGNQGDKNGFIENAQVALEALKKQDEKGSSIRLQRASTRVKAALKSAKADDLKAGIAEIEQGIAIMSEKR